MVARGCQRRCSYCAINESPLRYFSFPRIKAELKHILSRAPALKRVMVGCSDIYENAPLARQLLPLFRKAAEKRPVKFTFYANIEGLLKEDLLRLSDCPGFEFEIGVQSLNPSVLQLCRRRPNPDFIKERIARFKELAPSAAKVLGLIAFLPGDTEPAYLETLDWAISTELDISVNHLRVIPGTALYEHCALSGLKVSAKYPYFVTETATQAPSRISALSKLTGELFLVFKVLSLSPRLRRDFLKLAAGLEVRTPRVHLASVLSRWWTRRSSTARLAASYRENLRQTGSLDRSHQTGSFPKRDLALFAKAYRELEIKMRKQRS